MALKRKRVVFAPTDGVLELYGRHSSWYIRGVNWAADNFYYPHCELPFRKMSVRAVDAQLLGKDVEQVSLKVAALLPPMLSTVDCIAGIGGKLYDITKADEDGRKVYLYLTDLVSVGKCDLVEVKTTYDKVGLKKTVKTPFSVYMRDGVHSVSAAQHGALDEMDITIRSIDWQGERLVKVGDTEYRVQKAIGKGDWVTLQCSEGVADVK